MGKNAYAKQLVKNRDAREAVVKLWTAQMCLDAITIVLNDPDVMGRDTFGVKRLKKIQAAFNETFSAIYPALTRDNEASYIQANVDRLLSRICADEFIPWEKRYDGWEDHGI